MRSNNVETMRLFDQKLDRGTKAAKRLADGAGGTSSSIRECGLVLDSFSFVAVTDFVSIVCLSMRLFASPVMADEM